MEEATIERRPLDEAHRPSVRVWQNRLRPFRRARYRTEPVGDFSQCVIPTDTGKASAPLRPDATERVEQTVRMIRALDVSIDFGAEKPAGERMLRVAGDAHGASILDGNEHRARVWTVVRACAVDDSGIGEGKGLSSHGSLGAGRCKARRHWREGPAGAACESAVLGAGALSLQSLCPDAI